MVGDMILPAFGATLPLFQLPVPMLLALQILACRRRFRWVIAGDGFWNVTGHRFVPVCAENREGAGQEIWCQLEPLNVRAWIDRRRDHAAGLPGFQAPTFPAFQGSQAPIFPAFQGFPGPPGFAANLWVSGFRCLDSSLRKA